MGTRADFYVGCGPTAEWLGSVAFDGYQWADEDEDGNELEARGELRGVDSEASYRAAVALILSRDDATMPEMGWPWPWNDSRTTDYAYWWDGERVKWDMRDDWPDMTAVKNVTFGPRSGLIVITAKGLA